LVVPLGARAGDALELALVEDDVAFGDDAVLRLVDRHLVGLQAIDADARVNVPFVDDDARLLRAAYVIPVCVNVEDVRRLLARRGSLPSRARSDGRLILRERVDARRVGDGVLYFAVYGV